MKVGALVMAAVLAVTGCDLFGVKDTASGPSAPDMGSPSALPASGGTIPATSDGAKLLFTDAMTVMSTESYSITSTSQAINKNLLARATTIDTTSLDGTDYIGEGTITTSGSMTYSVTDEPYEVYFNLDATNTITNVTLTGTADTYTYNGKTVTKMEMNENIDTTTNAIDISMAIQAGYAVSVKRNSDNAGAKFILSYVFDYAKNDLQDYVTLETDLGNALKKKATLKVYDDNNDLQFSIDLTLDEVVNMNDLLSLM